jgi:hypothetical protein
MGGAGGPWTPKDTRRTVEIVVVIIGVAALVGFFVWLNSFFDAVTF